MTEICDRCGKEAVDCIGGTHYHCSDDECVRVVTIEELIWSKRVTSEVGQKMLDSGLTWNDPIFRS